MDVHRIDGIVGDEECVLVSRSVVYMVYVHIKTAVLQEEVDVGVANGIVANPSSLVMANAVSRILSIVIISLRAIIPLIPLFEYSKRRILL